MCKQKILSHNENGYVALCSKCSHYQIAFISTIITLTEIQFLEFSSQISRQLHYSETQTDENHKTFCIHTFSVNTRLILSLNELGKLVYLLNEANASIQVSNLLRGDLQTVLKEFQKDTKLNFSNPLTQINLN